MILHTCTKVNVGLNVLRRRPDGFHDIETLFVPYYGWADVLDVEPAAELSIEIERAEGVDWDPMDDLTVRAWRLLKADFPQLPPVRIGLQKFAPVGAGLGGGSADAAFMLRALNEIGELGLSDAALAAYAARLGSDCAFFVGLTPAKTTRLLGVEGRAPKTPPVADASFYCRPMFATGRGEVLEPFDIDLSGYELRVEIPLGPDGKPVAVSTREAYGGIVPRDRWRWLDCSSGIQPPVRKGQSRQDTAVAGPEAPARNGQGRYGAAAAGPEASVRNGQGLPGAAAAGLETPARNGQGRYDAAAAGPEAPARNGQGRQDTAAASPEAPVRNGQGLPGAAGTASIAEPSSSVILSEQSESKNPLPLWEALKLPVEQWRGLVVNDFEATVCPRHHEIPALIADFYRRGASYAAMSGSGSSVFGLFRK